jgi:hypothetical protein
LIEKTNDLHPVNNFEIMRTENIPVTGETDANINPWSLAVRRRTGSLSFKATGRKLIENKNERAKQPFMG